MDLSTDTDILADQILEEPLLLGPLPTFKTWKPFDMSFLTQLESVFLKPATSSIAKTISSYHLDLPNGHKKRNFSSYFVGLQKNRKGEQHHNFIGNRYISEALKILFRNSPPKDAIPCPQCHLLHKPSNSTKSSVSSKRTTNGKKYSSVRNPKKRKVLDRNHLDDNSDEETVQPHLSGKRTRGATHTSSKKATSHHKTRAKKSKSSDEEFGEDDIEMYEDSYSSSEPDLLDLSPDLSILRCTPCPLLKAATIELGSVIESECLCSEVHCQDTVFLKTLSGEYENRMVNLCTVLENNWSHLFTSLATKPSYSTIRSDHHSLPPILHPMSPPSRTASFSSLSSASTSFATPLSLYPATSTYSKKQLFVRLFQIF